jgi:hypothetical protein
MKTNAAATFLNVCLGTSALLVTAMLVRSEMAATRSLPVPQVRRLFLDSVPAGVDYFAGGHRIGPADKAPAMVVFSDYQCPACKLLHRELELRRNRSQHDLTIAYRHWPLSRHPHAERAAMASECAAPQGRFAQMHDSLFARSGNLEAVTSQQLALAAGVADIDRFSALHEQRQHRRRCQKGGRGRSRDRVGWHAHSGSSRRQSLFRRPSTSRARFAHQRALFVAVSDPCSTVICEAFSVGQRLRSRA